MEDISLFFQPVDIDGPLDEGSMAGHISSYIEEDSFPDVSAPGVAIIEVPEYRNSQHSPKRGGDFRRLLYSLKMGANWEGAIYDLGIIKPGETVKDTFHALAQVSSTLIRNNVTPIVIGGSQDLTIGLYNSYNKLEQYVNLTTIDSKFDFGTIEVAANAHAWLSHILLDKDCYLFNYSNLGAQSHFLSKKELSLFDQLYFDVNRLGRLSEDIKLAEPVLRNTDFVSFDLEVIRSSDIGGEFYDNPNGIFANQACQISRYAGISDKLTSFGIFNYYPSEKTKVVCNLVAQLIWYFIDGYENRKSDFPLGSKKLYKKFRVSLDDFKEEILFLKSDKSARWWMEVPYPDSKGKYQRHHLVPCSYKDYELTMKGEMPDLWWKTYQKLV